MVRLGLIGCGRIGRVHADSIDVHPRAQLARVYDPFEDAAREVGTQFGAAWGTDVDALIEDTSIDAVVVASATPTHVGLLTRSVQAGKANVLALGGQQCVADPVSATSGVAVRLNARPLGR